MNLLDPQMCGADAETWFEDDQPGGEKIWRVSELSVQVPPIGKWEN